MRESEAGFAQHQNFRVLSKNRVKQRAAGPIGPDDDNGRVSTSRVERATCSHGTATYQIFRNGLYGERLRL